MRGWILIGSALAAAGVAAIAAVGGGATTATYERTVDVPLPAAGQAQVTELAVKVTAPAGKPAGSLRVKVANAAVLGTAAVNTQVVGTVSPTSSKKRTATFRVIVVMHHWPAAPARKSGASHHVTSRRDAAPATANVTVKGQIYDRVSASIRNDHLDCQTLDDYGYTTDGFFPIDVYDWIPAYDTPAEEQLDNAVLAICPHAEADDPGRT